MVVSGNKFECSTRIEAKTLTCLFDRLYTICFTLALLLVYLWFTRVASLMNKSKPQVNHK